MEIQGRMFQIIRKFPEHQLNWEKADPSLLKEYFNCDTIFKSQGFIWFADEIKYIEYEEMIKYVSPIQKHLIKIRFTG